MSPRISSAEIRKFHSRQCFLILCLLFITMLCFGGVEPFSLPIAMVILGVVCILSGYGFYKKYSQIRLRFGALSAFSLFFWVLAWGYYQTLGGVPERWQHPAWSTLSAFLERDVTGRISVDAFASARELKWYIIYAITFISSVLFARSKKATDRAIYGFLALQVFFALFAIILKGIPLESPLGMFRRGYPESLTSSLINRNSYAGYVGMGLCMSVAVLCSALKTIAPRRNGQTLSAWVGEQYEAKRIAFYVGLSLCLFVVLVNTGSRAGLGTSLAGAGAIILITQWKNLNFRRINIIIVLFLAVLFAVSQTDLLQRIQPDTLDNGILLRKAIIELSYRAFTDHPFLGTGLGSYNQIITAYMEAGDVDKHILLSAHNTYLEVMIELGLIGAVPLFCLVFGIIGYTLYPSKNPYTVAQLCLIGLVVQLGLHSLVDFTLEIPSNFLAAAMITGVACGQRFYLTQDQHRTGSKARTARP